MTGIYTIEWRLVTVDRRWLSEWIVPEELFLEKKNLYYLEAVCRQDEDLKQFRSLSPWRYRWRPH